EKFSLIPPDTPALESTEKRPGAAPPQFQVVSETHAPPGPVVVTVVPPTSVMLVLSDGKGIPFTKASPSPEALKNDCPCASICLKMFSAVRSGASGAESPHEQLNCFGELTVS